MTRKKEGRTGNVDIQAVRFYDEDFIAIKFAINRRDFHRYIKPLIMADFPDLLREIGVQNPDIGLDDEGYIYLSNTDHTIVKPTGLKIFDYI